jgi:hypothetical protein
MKMTVTLYDFERAFEQAGRADSFSYSGKEALFEYLEQYEDDCGEQIELDVVALCCEYTEYNSALEAADGYDFQPDTEQDEEEQEEAALEYLRDNTQVIEFDGGVIVQDF